MTSLPLTDWMAALDGQRGLSELTIPGTHDSAALHGGLRPETQTMDILSQLRAGIRYLDVRLIDDGGVLRLYHGDVDQEAELGPGALDPTRAFLAQHPGETVIMSVKKEDTGDDGAFARDFEALVAGRADDFIVAPEFPSLAGTRGRIVVVRRYAAGTIGISAPPAQWRNDSTFQIESPAGTLFVEDEWQVGGPLPWQMDAKWDAVARNLDAARAATTGWYVTFTSGASDFSFPRAIAGGIPFIDGMNQRLHDYLADHAGPLRLGTIVMDFPELPDGRLIQSLVDVNR